MFVSLAVLTASLDPGHAEDRRQAIEDRNDAEGRNRSHFLVLVRVLQNARIGRFDPYAHAEAERVEDVIGFRPRRARFVELFAEDRLYVDRHFAVLSTCSA
jgi:hypothetical protein